MIDTVEAVEQRPRSRWLERLIEADRAERLADSVPEAVKWVAEECGYPVTAAEELDGNLWCWTFQPLRPESKDG